MNRIKDMLEEKADDGFDKIYEKLCEDADGPDPVAAAAAKERVRCINICYDISQSCKTLDDPPESVRGELDSLSKSEVIRMIGHSTAKVIAQAICCG